MKVSRLFVSASRLMILALVLASCAPSVSPSATAKPTAPAAKAETPAAKPAAPAAKAETPVAKPAATPAAPAPTPKPSADEPKSGGLLTISLAEDPISMDLHQDGVMAVRQTIQCAYNGITQFDPNRPGTVIGDLAKNWEISKDGLTYTFHLNENAKFHDGTPFTAEDVRFSFLRMIDPPKGIRSLLGADLAAIDKIEAPDKNTVRFILKYAFSPLMNVVSSGSTVIYSGAFVSAKGDMKKDIMGTGPFKLKAYSPGAFMEYVKNPDYFVKGRPYLNGITFYLIKDAATRLAAFRAGQIKLTGTGVAGLRPSEVETVKKTSASLVVMTYNSLAFPNIMFNVEQAPWTDVRTRRAVHLAIDRQAAANILGQGYGEMGSNFPGEWGIPREDLLKMPGYRQPKDADIAEAKKLLAEAGHADGLRVNALVRAGRDDENLAVFLSDQLAKVGIKIELDVKEMAVRTTLARAGNFSLHPFPTSSLAYPDPQDIARYWAAPLGDNWGVNFMRYRDDKIIELFDKQSRAVDPEERKKIVREIDLGLIDAAARPLIYWRSDIIGMWPEVKNRGRLLGWYNNNKYQDTWLAK